MAQHTLKISGNGCWQRRYAYNDSESWNTTARLVVGYYGAGINVGRYKIPLSTCVTTDLEDKPLDYLLIEVPLSNEYTSKPSGVVAKLSISDLNPNQVSSTTFNSSSSRAYKDPACTTLVGSTEQLSNTTVYYKIDLSGMDAGATYYVYFYGDTDDYSLYGTDNSLVGDVHLYTKDNINIIYKPGANADANQSVAYGLATIGVACTLKGTIFTRTGYTQTGWSTSDNGSKTYNVSGSATFTSDIILYPYWTPNIYKATLDKKGGTGGYDCYYWKYRTYTTIDGVRCYYYTDSKCIIPVTNGFYIATPTRAGYTFKGYFSSDNTQFVDATGMCINALFMNVSSNITLTAQWEINKNIVNIVSDGTTCQGVAYVYVNGEYKQGIAYVKTPDGYKTL